MRPSPGVSRFFNVPHPQPPGCCGRGAIVGPSGVQLALSNRAPDFFFLDCLAQSGVRSRELLLGLVTRRAPSSPPPEHAFPTKKAETLSVSPSDTIFTDIARAVAPEDKHRNVENRLSRNLQTEGLHEKVRDDIQADAVRFIDRNTPVIHDPTDVCKPHSHKMENLSLVRDASRSSKESVVKTRGCHGCMAVACKSGSRKTVPLDLRIWSSSAEGHKGENEEVLDIMRAVDKATDGRGIRVYDRGGDRPAFYDCQLETRGSSSRA